MNIFLLTSLFFLLILCNTLFAGLLFVEKVSTNGDGSLNSPFNSIQTALSTAQAGDTVMVKPGLYEEGELTFKNNGTAVNPIVLTTFDPANRPVLKRSVAKVMLVNKSYIVVDGFVMDGSFADNRILRIRSGGNNVTIRNCEIRNALNNGIDFGSIRDLTIEKCEVHHVLAGTFTNQLDAHGITGGNSFNINIAGCNVHHFTGDAFQIDPGRNDWDSVSITDSELWTGPLDADYAGFKKGESPGENAIDTKVKAGISYRPKLFLQNIRAHGFTNNGYIGNRAAFNLKEGVDVVVNGCTLYDNEIAFRVRGPGSRGGAHVTIINSIAYDNEKVFRAEDKIEALLIYNNTFGQNTQWMQKAGGGYNPQGYAALNNLFLGAVPADATDPSNKAAVASDFVDAGNHDFTLVQGSSFLTNPDVSAVPEITVDVQGTTWRNENNVIGAQSSATATVLVGDNLDMSKVKVHLPNPLQHGALIRYFAAYPSFATIELFNNRGQLIRTLMNGEKSRGEYVVGWEGKESYNFDIRSGLYYLVLTLNSLTQVHKIIILK